MQSWHDARANDTKIEIGFHLAELCCECEYPHTHTHAHTNPHTHRALFTFTQNDAGAQGGRLLARLCPSCLSFYYIKFSTGEAPKSMQHGCTTVSMLRCIRICLCVTIGGRSCVFRCVGVPESVVRLLTCCAAFHICVYNLLCLCLPLPLPLHVCVGVPVHVSMLVYVWVCVCICGCFNSFQGFMLLKTLQVRM